MNVREILDLSSELSAIENKVGNMKGMISMFVRRLREEDPTTKHNTIQLKKIRKGLTKIVDKTTEMTFLLNSLQHREIKEIYRPLLSVESEYESEDESEDESETQFDIQISM